MIYLENRELHEEVKDLKKNNAELVEKIKTLESEVEAVTVINEEFGKESDRQRDEINNLKKEIDRLKSVESVEHEMIRSESVTEELDSKEESDSEVESDGKELKSEEEPTIK